MIASSSASASLDLEHDHRDFVQAGALRGAPAALARDDLVGTGGAAQRAHRDRLDDAALLDGGGEFVELGGGEVAARIAGVGPQDLDRQPALAARRARRELVSAPMSPISDASPRPSRDRVRSSAIAGLSRKVVHRLRYPRVTKFAEHGVFTVARSHARCPSIRVRAG